jgi:hypothetical protein
VIRYTSALGESGDTASRQSSSPLIPLPRRKLLRSLLLEQGPPRRKGLDQSLWYGRCCGAAARSGVCGVRLACPQGGSGGPDAVQQRQLGGHEAAQLVVRLAEAGLCEGSTQARTGDRAGSREVPPSRSTLRGWRGETGTLRPRVFAQAGAVVRGVLVALTIANDRAQWQFHLHLPVHSSSPGR